MPQIHEARELAAHGHADAARIMAGRTAVWYKARVETGKPTPAVRSSYANALLRAGVCQDGLRVRRDLLREVPDNLGARGSYATALVACGGSRSEAQKIAEALARVDRPFLLGQHLYQRARILAALGDGEGAVRASRTPGPGPQGPQARGSGHRADGDAGHDEPRSRPHACR